MKNVKRSSQTKAQPLKRLGEPCILFVTAPGPMREPGAKRVKQRIVEACKGTSMEGIPVVVGSEGLHGALLYVPFSRG